MIIRSALPRWFAAALILLLACAAHADGPSFAIRAARIMPVSPDHPWVIENGVIVVRDGRVTAIGTDVDVPADLRVIEMPDATIVPGFVAASCGLGGQHSGDQSVGAGYQAIDAFDLYGDFRTTLASGVTTVHLNPGWHRLISGRGAVVHLEGDPDGRIALRSSDLTINLGSGAINPPPIVELTIPPSPDQEIKPARSQRPASRMTQFIALKEAIQQSIQGAMSGGSYSIHDAALAEAWGGGLPLRVQAQSSSDLAGAIAFMRQQKRTGYLVGGLEASDVADQIAASGLPLVYTLDPALRSPGGNLGADPNRDDRSIEALAKFDGVRRLALALANGRSISDLRLAAAMARRSGLGKRRILEAITRVPAEILGVGDEVGSLSPGHRADLLVLTGDPLETATQVQRVYVGGALAYSAPMGQSLVVRAGTVWLGPGDWLESGEVLIEDGKITEVGRRVGRPPNSRVVNAGPHAFVTPGLIDAHGHLGLGGDTGTPGPNLSLTRLIGPTDLPEHRVARSGVTSVVLSPYGFGSSGAQVSVVKTAGQSRSDRVARHTAGVGFDVGNNDAKSIGGRIKSRLGQGKQYVEKWQKYEKELEEWKKKKAEGKLEATKPKVVETEEPGGEADPITGTWDAVLTGGPLPEPQRGKIAFKLEGNQIEGRLLEPEVPVEVRITGELDGKRVSGEIELDTGGMGTPTWEGEIVEDDLIRGTAGLGAMMSVEFELRRTDKGTVEFKVARKRRTTGEGGRPLPPDVDESLEPLRALLEKRVPAIVKVTGRTQIEAVLDVFVDEFELPLILLNANDSRLFADRIREAEVGVVVPANVLRRENNAWYHQGLDLNQQGVTVSFQSNAEDGARTLRDVVLFAVQQGLSPEAALAGLTVNAAKMYHMDDRIGSIAPGRDGDLVIFSGYPFDAGSAVERVIINGEEVLR